MNYIFWVFMFILALGVFVFAFLPIGKWKGVAVVVYILMSGVVAFGSLETLGLPKPIWLEWKTMHHLPIRGFYWDEDNQVVYLWVIRNGIPQTYAYPFPKDRKRVEVLQDEERSADHQTEFFTEEEGKDEVAKVQHGKPLPPK